MEPLTRPDAAAPERCLVCGGRHASHLRADGRRGLTIKQVALHLGMCDEQVYKLIKCRALAKAPNRGPRQTAVLEKNVVNYQEGRPQEYPPDEFSRPQDDRRRSKAV